MCRYLLDRLFNTKLFGVVDVFVDVTKFHKLYTTSSTWKKNLTSNLKPQFQRRPQVIIGFQSIVTVLLNYLNYV